MRAHSCHLTVIMKIIKVREPRRQVVDQQRVQRFSMRVSGVQKRTRRFASRNGIPILICVKDSTECEGKIRTSLKSTAVKSEWVVTKRSVFSPAYVRVLVGMRLLYKLFIGHTVFRSLIA